MEFLLQGNRSYEIDLPVIIGQMWIDYLLNFTNLDGKDTQKNLIENFASEEPCITTIKLYFGGKVVRIWELEAGVTEP